MKAKEAKQLIGRRVEWEYAKDVRRGTFFVRHGILEAVQGRNVLISGDWHWLPELTNLKLSLDKPTNL